MGRDEHRVQVHWTARERLTILSEDRHDMAMQVHWMIQVGLIIEMELDELPFLHHQHSSIRKDLAVEHIGHPGPSQRGAQLVAQHDAIGGIEMALRCEDRKSTRLNSSHS